MRRLGIVAHECYAYFFSSLKQLIPIFLSELGLTFGGRKNELGLTQYRQRGDQNEIGPIKNVMPDIHYSTSKLIIKKQQRATAM